MPNDDAMLERAKEAALHYFDEGCSHGGLLPANQPEFCNACWARAAVAFAAAEVERATAELRDIVALQRERADNMTARYRHATDRLRTSEAAREKAERRYRELRGIQEDLGDGGCLAVRRAECPNSITGWRCAWCKAIARHDAEAPSRGESGDSDREDTREG